MRLKKIVGWLIIAGMIHLIPAQGIAAPETGSSDASKVKASASTAAPKTSSYQFSPPAVPASSQTAARTKSVSGGVGSDEVPKQEVAPDYKILVGDRISVKIYPEDQYIKGGVMQVSSEGSITLPLIGKVKVAEKTLVEAEKDLVKIIDADYLVNPEVVIEVTQSILKTEEKKRKAIALGQVRKPGSYEFPPNKESITLLELISMAGGFTEIANIKKIKIIRKQDGKKNVQSVNGENVMSGSEPDIDLGDGDVINVAESVF